VNTQIVVPSEASAIGASTVIEAIGSTVVAGGNDGPSNVGDGLGDTLGLGDGPPPLSRGDRDSRPPPMPTTTIATRAASTGRRRPPVEVIARGRRCQGKTGSCLVVMV